MKSSTILPRIARKPTGLSVSLNIRRLIALVLLPVLLGLPGGVASAAAAAALPDTAPLAPGQGGVGNWDGVINAEIEGSTAARSQHWRRDFSSAKNYNRSIETNRARFAHIIGVRDPRVAFEAPSLMATVDQPALVGRGKSSWPGSIPPPSKSTKPQSPPT